MTWMASFYFGDAAAEECPALNDASAVTAIPLSNIIVNSFGNISINKRKIDINEASAIKINEAEGIIPKCANH